MKEAVNTNMIILAREARGLAQNELAEKIKMSPANLSKIERGDIGISANILEAIAEETSFPPHFFTQPGSILPENLSYRKRQSVAQKLIAPINAQANIIRKHIQFLTRALNLSPPQLPVISVTETQTPEKIAARVRQKWNIELPVIDNLTRLFESHGIAIVPFDFGTERVDSRSMLTDDKYPVIFLNKALLGDKLRFSLAYELGQLIMHTFTSVPFDRDIPGEANAFAAAFLMPPKEIRKDFENGINIPLLGELKKKWKVSMISLLYRADDLGFLTPNQRRYLLQQFNTLGIRRREPVELDISIEQPNLAKRWISGYCSKTKLGTREMAAILCLNTDEYMEIYS
jgi:Zn-dependent peptidase ImmA (M78 family)/DNA-binding Xre family transcriptional regulator